jgi:L-amino acid N-acyltransferase YncA
MRARAATPDDAVAIAAIYNEGIDDGIATFETRRRSAEDVRAWFGRDRFPVVVVEEEEAGERRVIAFAATWEYRPRECYVGIADFSVYVARAARGRGVGRLAMNALIDAAAAAGFWKLVSRVFVENLRSRAMLQAIGFREVGIYERHARLHGAWKDVVIVERLLGPALGP